jgi:hypothetical protein
MTEYVWELGIDWNEIEATGAPDAPLSKAELEKAASPRFRRGHETAAFVPQFCDSPR